MSLFDLSAVAASNYLLIYLILYWYSLYLSYGENPRIDTFTLNNFQMNDLNRIYVNERYLISVTCQRLLLLVIVIPHKTVDRSDITKSRFTYD